MKKAFKQTEKAISGYLQIEDKAVIDFVLNFIGGLLTSRMLGGEEIASYEEQGELLAKMLNAYLGNKE